MKNRILAILLSFVFTFSLSIPALAAAPVDRPDLYTTTYARSLEIFNSYTPPAGYNYSFVAIISPLDQTIVGVYSTTPVINPGSPVIVVYARDNGIDPTVYKVTYKQTYYASPQYVSASFQSPEVGSMNVTYLHQVVNLSSATFSDINNVVKSDFFVNVFSIIDKTVLKALLNKANSISDIGYSKSSFDRLASAITAGQSVYDNATVTQQTVDNAATTLKTAIDALILLPTVPDLKARIASASSIQDVGYTPTSWNSLQSSITSGQSLLNSREYSQSQLIAADNRIKTAVENLQLAVVVPPDPPITPPDDGTHEYLIDGIRIQDLMPAQDAMMQNINFGMKNGIILFAILIAIWLIPVILRRIISIQSESRFIDWNEPSTNSRFERNITTNQIQKRKYSETDINKK